MFTGLIQATADVVESVARDGSLYLTITRPTGWTLAAGDSVAVNGTCLTVTDLSDAGFSVELMPETLNKTSFSQDIPKRANLERPLRLSDLVDGHLVQGHVDVVGRIKDKDPQGNSMVYTIEYPPNFAAQIVEKGSIAVDGISLTAIQVKANNFSVSLVEYTLTHTTLPDKDIGERVNLEFDMIAKYVAKLLGTKGGENATRQSR